MALPGDTHLQGTPLQLASYGLHRTSGKLAVFRVFLVGVAVGFCPVLRVLCCVLLCCVVFSVFVDNNNDFDYSLCLFVCFFIVWRQVLLLFFFL